MGQLGDVTDRSVSNAFNWRLGVSPNIGLTLGPELVPTIDFSTVPEIQYHLGWRRWSHSIELSSSPNFGFWQLRNPDGLNTMIVVEQMLVGSFVGSPAGNQFVMTRGVGPGQADFGTVAAGHFYMDGRNPNTVAKGMAVISWFLSSTGAAVQNVNWADMVLFPATGATVGSYQAFPFMPIVLMPGNFIQVQAFASTLSDTACFKVIWRERRLNDSENTP